jgi:4-alpha-glucanotransferase
MSTPYYSDLLLRLSARCGIALEYHDIWGQAHHTTSDTAVALLTAMGVAAETEEAIAASLDALEHARWTRVCEPVQVVSTQEWDQATWLVHVPVVQEDQDDVEVRWSLRDEAGLELQQGVQGPHLVPVEESRVGGQRYVCYGLRMPSLPMLGYYRLSVVVVVGAVRLQGSLALIVTPPQCYIPEPFTSGVRLWGPAVQLYSLRSDRNWGVGDFTDLQKVCEWSAQSLGAGMVGVNPLHALRNSRPYHISPYSPDSRLYLNELYVDIEQVPEWADCQAAHTILGGQTGQYDLEQLRRSPVVEYDQVIGLKRRIFEVLFDECVQRHLDGRGLEAVTSRGTAFLAFVKREGEALEHYALFQALRERFEQGATPVWGWQEWPVEYQDPRSPAVLAFRLEHATRVLFFQYVQWVAAEQLTAVMQTCRHHEMVIGLYHDLALGSDRSGSDAWRCQSVLALQADCGAPPDAFAPQGQNWGLPPFNPVRLRDEGYAVFIELLRHNLRYGGALRLDHVMALFRLFWIPRGRPAAEGTYVQYPAKDLLGILALESIRHQAVIIGEDLGTVPDSVREQLLAVGVLSYRVFYFERAWDGGWKSPDAYPAQALAVVNTHDLPTLKGFWAGHDIDVRYRLGIIPTAEAKDLAMAERDRDKMQIFDALTREGVWDPRTQHGSLTDFSDDLLESIHAYAARTSSWMMLVNLDDFSGEETQSNLPGTLDTYPNWSRKMSRTVEELRFHPPAVGLARILTRLRPGGTGRSRLSRKGTA